MKSKNNSIRPSHFLNIIYRYLPTEKDYHKQEKKVLWCKKIEKSSPKKLISKLQNFENWIFRKARISKKKISKNSMFEKRNFDNDNFRRKKISNNLKRKISLE